jgi:hypothetical protein
MAKLNVNGKPDSMVIGPAFMGYSIILNTGSIPKPTPESVTEQKW